MTALTLPSGSIVEVDDIILGGRKLGVVDATGLGYFDLHGVDMLPLVLHAKINPQDLGSIASWMSSENAHLLDVWKTMTDRNLDQLTIARALRWAIQNDAVDEDSIIKMGESLTDQVKKSKQIVVDSLKP